MSWSSTFGLLLLCMGRKSEWAIVRLVALFACTKSTDFHGILVGWFAMGAKNACRWLLLPCMSRKNQWVCCCWAVEWLLLVMLRERGFEIMGWMMLQFRNFWWSFWDVLMLWWPLLNWRSREVCHCRRLAIVLVPSAVFFDCRVREMIPWLIWLYFRPNVVRVMLPVFMSFVQVRKRDY